MWDYLEPLLQLLLSSIWQPQHLLQQVPIQYQILSGQGCCLSTAAGPALCSPLTTATTTLHPFLMTQLLTHATTTCLGPQPRSLPSIELLSFLIQGHPLLCCAMLSLLG